MFVSNLWFLYGWLYVDMNRVPAEPEPAASKSCVFYLLQLLNACAQDARRFKHVWFWFWFWFSTIVHYLVGALVNVYGYFLKNSDFFLKKKSKRLQYDAKVA